jgi:hypothetical protein
MQWAGLETSGGRHLACQWVIIHPRDTGEIAGRWASPLQHTGRVIVEGILLVLKSKHCTLTTPQCYETTSIPAKHVLLPGVMLAFDTTLQGKSFE